MAAGERAASGAGTTVAQLCAEFVKRALIRRDGEVYAQPQQVERLLNAEVLGIRYNPPPRRTFEQGPGWGARTLDTITGREVIELCAAVEDRGSRGTARVLRRTLKAMFAYAHSAYLIPASPVTNLKGGKSGKRKRFLTVEEIRAVWRARWMGPDGPRNASRVETAPGDSAACGGAVRRPTVDGCGSRRPARGRFRRRTLNESSRTGCRLAR